MIAKAVSRQKSFSRGDKDITLRSYPTAVQAILRSVLKKHGLEAKIEKYAFVSRWSEIVGTEIAKKTKPEIVRGKTLIVRVSDSAWAQELSFHKQAILTRMKRLSSKGNAVEDIRFEVGKI